MNPSLQEIKQSYVKDIAFYSYCNDPELQMVAIEDSSLLKDLFQQKDIVENKDHTCATCEIDLKG